MFDTVGKSRKQDKGRQLSSMLLALLTLSTGVIGVVRAGGQIVEEVDDEPVEVTFFDSAPPPPPPPPPPAGGQSKPKVEKQEEPEEVEPEVEPEPDELPEEVPEPEVQPEVAADAGVVGGVEGGVEGGVVGGVVGGEIGGVLGGEIGGTGVQSVHWTDVKKKRDVKPVFPEAARALGIQEETCLVRIFIDEKGEPYDIKIEKCSNVFHDAIEEAVWKWRFYPMKSENGQAVKASFTSKIIFRLN